MYDSIFAISFQGDWILILVHLNKQYGWELESYLPDVTDSSLNIADQNDTSSALSSGSPLFSSYFKNFHWFFIMSTIVSFVTYYSLAGYLQYYYYVSRKDQV